MQGQSSNSDSHPENFDINLGSFPHNNDMNQHNSLNNGPHVEGSRLTNNMVAPSEAMLANAVNHGVEDFAGWNLGHPSTVVNPESQVSREDRKGKQVCAPSMTVGAGSSSGGRQFERPTVFFMGNHIEYEVPADTVGRGNSLPQNAILNEHYVGRSAEPRLSDGPSLNNCHSLAVDNVNPNIASMANFQSSSGSSDQMEDTSGESSSMGNWGLSCKRRACEDASGHLLPGSSSVYSPYSEVMGPPPTGLNLSPPASWNSACTNYQELVEPSNSSNGMGMREGDSNNFPSSVGEIPMRNFSGRVNSRSLQDSVTLNLSAPRSARRANAQHQSRRLRNPLDPRLAPGAIGNLHVPRTDLNVIPSPGPLRNMDAIPWNAASALRSGNLSNSFPPGEVAAQDGPNVRSISRSINIPMFSLAAEARNMLQDGENLSSTARSTGIPGFLPPPTLRIGASSGTQSSPPSWVPNHPLAPNRQELLELAPWSLSSSVGAESSRHSGPLAPVPSGASSSQQTAVSAGPNDQDNHSENTRSSVDRRLDGVHESWRALTSNVEGRQRVVSEILQVLEAMQRGERVRAEPFLNNGYADMHDIHRDMRLDVDNMSYEELLALEERIGDVSTGLNEEAILKGLKRCEKCASVGRDSFVDAEPCCICQEEYVDGDDLGILNCGHEFHADCIKQWLMHKNLCPICKTTGLPP